MHEETVVIREQVGSGGSATVYRGSLSPSSADVAVKIVKKDLQSEKGRKIYNRTKSESRIMSEINHKHVCKIMGEVETDANIFLVLQYAANGDLLDRLNAQGPLSEKQTRKIFKQLVLAINYLHGRGVVHRDLKPGTTSTILIFFYSYAATTSFYFASATFRRLRSFFHFLSFPPFSFTDVIIFLLQRTSFSTKTTTCCWATSASP